MKTLLYYSATAILLLLLAAGCSKSTTHTTTTADKDKRIPWHYMYAEEPVLSDEEVEEIQYWISNEVKMGLKNVDVTGTPDENGNLKTERETEKIIQTINKKMKGEAIEVARDEDGYVSQLTVSFDTADITFTLQFTRNNDDGFFYLYDLEVPYITGETFNLYYKRSCKLLFVKEEKKVKKVIRKKASGDSVTN